MVVVTRTSTTTPHVHTRLGYHTREMGWGRSGYTFFERRSLIFARHLRRHQDAAALDPVYPRENPERLAAAIPPEDYWRFSDVSRGVRAAPRRAPTSEGLRQGPQPHTSRCVRPRTAVRATTPPSAQRCLQASGRLQRALTSEMAAGLNCFWFTGLTQPKLKFGARSAP